MRRLAVVGGGPAGLMAAEVARAHGIDVDVYEGKGSVGRKFLIAGKGGLNLTHSEPYANFVTRYGAHQHDIARWLSEFNADHVRAWARSLNIDTFVGTSGRVFPADLKAAPLLRSWVRRLREQGVRFHVHHYCVGLDDDRALHFLMPSGEQLVRADAIVLAMGGASWPELGSDGNWVEWLRGRSDIAPLQPANCGFDVGWPINVLTDRDVGNGGVEWSIHRPDQIGIPHVPVGWSEVFGQRYAGHPVKSVKVSTRDANGDVRQLQGEFVVTATGIEGSAIYALASMLRDAIARVGAAQVLLDLAPDIALDRLQDKLAQPRKGRSLTEHLRRAAGIEGVKTGLLYECLSKEALANSVSLAAAIKGLSLKLVRPRPIAEAISSAGGVRFAALNGDLMIQSLPGVFCAGEMIDWEAPTGGYLLTACFASGRVAARGAANWLTGSNASRSCGKE